MFARYILDDMHLSKFDEKYKTIGENIWINNRKTLEDVNLEHYLIYNNSLSSELIEEDWFPSVKADVFLSHSHDDLDTAKCIAGYLKEKYGINTFIDSCVWGYMDELLKKFDVMYAKKTDKSYYYSKRNKTTAVAHMLLTAALTKMIDKTECIMFLNTPKAIHMNKIKSTPSTFSPWIYHEVLMCNCLNISIPKDINGLLQEIVQEYTQFSDIKVEFKVCFDKFTHLNFDSLCNLIPTNRDLGNQYLLNLYQNEGVII